VQIFSKRVIAKATTSFDKKAKLVLKVLEGEKTLNEIASEYEILPKNLQNWKKQFLENMSLTFQGNFAKATAFASFDKSTVVKEYKTEIEELQKSNDNLAKKVGNLTMEKEFLEGKLKLVSFLNIIHLVLYFSLSSKGRKTFIDTKLDISLNRQCQILGISKSSLYYEPVKKYSSEYELQLLNAINDIYSEFPYYGTRRIVTALKNMGYNIGRKLVKSMMAYMGIKAIYPTKKTTIPNKEHEKYPYLLKQFKNDKNQVIIDTPNKVWSTDITYIKLEKGYVYLAAIIDWNTKKILSWKLSNTMDVSLTTSVLNEALSLYPKPEIFNSDQGSQYTAKAHVEILKSHNIQISMDGKGRSIDNICIERFWRSIKYEEIYLNDYKSMNELRYSIDNYMKKYNSKRLHSAIGNKTPNEVYFKAINNVDINLLQKVS
jgi:putative transposase